MGYFNKVQKMASTRFWINNVTREEAMLAIGAGACGCTQNPAYTWKMLTNPKEKEYALSALDQIMEQEKDDAAALVALQRSLIGAVAQTFYPMYRSSAGRYGYVSIQGDPFRENAGDIVRFANFNRQAGDNIMCKIPAVPGGLEAIAKLAEQGIPINATECMALEQVLDVCRVYEKATRNKVNPQPIYYSVITGIFDEHLKSIVEKEDIDIDDDVLWYAGLAVAKKTYHLVKQRGYNAQFIGGGARTKYHFTEMVGADCQVTINWSGMADQLLDEAPPVIERFWMPTPEKVVDELRLKLDDFRRAFDVGGIHEEEYEDFGPVVRFRSSFEKAWKNALELIRERRSGQ